MKISNKIEHLSESLIKLFPQISIDIEENDFSFTLGNLDGNSYTIDDIICLSIALADCRLMRDEEMDLIDDKIADKLIEEVNQASFDSRERDFYYTKMDGRIVYLEMTATSFREQQIITFFELAEKLSRIINK
jgi:hypothetical protein